HLDFTPCFSFCHDSYTYRYRTLLQPAKFSQSICTGHFWDEAACQASVSCTLNEGCGTDFQCAETGRCIKRHLVCNGEPDCGDESDEANCEDAVRFCDDLFPIPGSERAVQGYNILTEEGRQFVYDPTYYGGQCESVYNGEWRELKYDSACERLYYGDDEKYFRKPYNFHFYQFLAHADSGFSSEYYDDATDLLDAIKKEKSRNFGLTVGIGLTKVPAISAMLSLQNVGFIRARTQVQTARFKMRRDNIVLHEDLLQSLMELPEEYDYGMYSKLINDYGTHFITSGTMGGIFEFILVVNKDEMRRKGQDNFSRLVFFPLWVEKQLGLSLTASSNKCKKDGFQTAETDGEKSAVEDIIPRVQGGSLAASGGLLGSWDANTYRHWGRSLKLNPAVIDFELQPIYELLRRANLANIETKRQNLKRALDQYLIEFNACRCGPCLNNGEPVLMGTSCQCHCPQGYEGLACEKTSRRGKTNGQWSCWTTWSPCQSGTRRRTRQCNNPAPQNGGTGCAGNSVQSDTCS
uniref:Complement C8 alpha chain n=1 Tax=Sphenodon punctatus TaxID=8508 RepID=A0A8D0LA65_SPHPU